jgi:hypothetical protein
MHYPFDLTEGYFQYLRTDSVTEIKICQCDVELMVLSITTIT